MKELKEYKPSIIEVIYISQSDIIKTSQGGYDDEEHQEEGC